MKPRANRARDPARALLLFPERRKQIEVARRAQACDVDVLRPHAGVHELIAIREPRVEARLRRARTRGEPAVHVGGGVSGRTERVDELVPHLVAARADARADRSDQIPRLHSKLTRERADRGGCGTGRRSPPSCMHGCDRARLLITEEERNAVGRADGKGHAGIVGNKNVCLGPIA